MQGESLLTRADCDTGGRGLRQNLTPQAQRALIRSGSKRAEALESLTQQVTELQATLQAERGSKEVSAARVRQVEEELSAAQNSLKAERLLLQKVRHPRDPMQSQAKGQVPCCAKSRHQSILLFHAQNQLPSLAKHFAVQNHKLQVTKPVLSCLCPRLGSLHTDRLVFIASAVAVASILFWAHSSLLSTCLL